jgi:hypothetical protein
MPLPVINDVFLVRWVWNSTFGQRSAINDTYWHDDAGGQTGTDLYNDMNAQILRNMWSMVHDSAGVDTVLTTKLDGSAATIPHATGTPAKWVGLTTGPAILQGANVVTIRSGFRGRSKRGRIYLPFVAEGAQDNGTLTPALVTQAQTAWGTFLTGMLAAGWSLHVVSQKLGSSVASVSVTVQPYLKTQRRRARR